MGILVLPFVLALCGICILLPILSRDRPPANRSLCSANLTGISKAAYYYSVTNNDAFPRYDSAQPEGAAPSQNGSLCSSNLTNIYRGAYVYSVTHDDAFPRYDSAQPKDAAPTRSRQGVISLPARGLPLYSVDEP